MSTSVLQSCTGPTTIVLSRQGGSWIKTSLLKTSELASRNPDGFFVAGLSDSLERHVALLGDLKTLATGDLTISDVLADFLNELLLVHDVPQIT